MFIGILFFSLFSNVPISNSQIPTEPAIFIEKPELKLKFDTGFDDKIINMINAGDNRYYDVILMVKKTSDKLKDNTNVQNNFIGSPSPVNTISKQTVEINKDDLERDLTNIHGATNVYKGKILSFVTASVPINKIPMLANYDYVINVGDGEKKMELELDVSRSSIFADNLSFNGTGVTVSVIDTAIRQFHQDMPNSTKIVNQVTCSNTGCTSGVTSPSSDHGTHVAGIIAGLGNVDPDLRGIATGALLLNPVNVGNATSFAHALDWSLQNGAKVINLSQGFPINESCTEDVENHIADEAVDEGVVFIKSAGNQGPTFETITDPGCGYNVISVGNMNDNNTLSRSDDVIHTNSSRGPTFDGRLKPEIVAPGTLINSTDLEMNYEPVTGTSFAAPHVSGTAALILQAQPQFSPLEVKSALLLGAQWNPTNATSLSSTATEYENAGSTDTVLSTYGFGYLNTSNSLTYANSGKNIVLDSINQDDVIDYSFSATQGDQIKIILSWLHHPGGTIITPENKTVSNLDFVIKKPDGSTIISNSTNQNNEFAVFNATTTGEYTITISAPYVTPATAFKETFALASTHPLQKGTFLVKEGTFVKSLSGTSPQLARPISDLNVGSWTSTPLYSKLNETSPDDATFVTSPSGTGPQFEIRLGNLTDPEISTDHVIKFRAKASSGGGAAEKANAILFQGTTQIAQTGLETLSRTGFTQFEYTLTSTEADSITDYHDLSVVITTSKQSSEEIQVSWIEFEVPAIPAVQTISGLGFHPKALILFTTGQTTEGIFDGYKFSIGYSNGTSSRSIGVASDDAAASSSAGRSFGTKALSILTDGTPTIAAEADLLSFDNDSFTIKWTTNDSVSSKINYIVLGGDSLTNATVSSFATPTVTGNQNVSVGFKPDFLMFMHAASTSETSSETNSYLSYGFAKSSTQMGAIAIVSEDRRASMDTWHMQRTDRSIVMLDETSGSIDAESDLVSMNADGFTLNWIDAPSDPDRVYYLALKGGGYDIGSFNKVVSSAPVTQTVSSSVSDIKGMILSSTNDVASSSVQSHNRLSFGASDGVTESGVWTADKDGVPDAITAKSTTDSKIIRMATETASGSSSTIDTESNLQSFTTNKFTLNWTTNDSIAKEIIYVTFGNYDFTTGLVGHWNLDENAGFVTADISGNNNTGTLINGTTWLNGTSCKDVNCLGFDGVNDDVTILDSDTLEGMSQFTLSVWAKRNVNGTIGVGERHYVVGKTLYHLSLVDSYGIWNQDYGYNARIILESNTGCDFGFGSDTDTTNFHHLVLMYRDNTFYSYLDGILGGTCGPFSPSTINKSSFPVTFARAANPTQSEPSYFNGTLDQVRIYNRSMTDTEVLQLFELGK